MLAGRNNNSFRNQHSIVQIPGTIWPVALSEEIFCKTLGIIANGGKA